MKNTNKKTDFTGVKIYVGMDVHKKRWVITIYIMGMRMTSFSMDAKPKDLIKYLGRNYPNGEYYTVYEAGFCGYWIDRQLRESGINNIVVNPADVPTTHKEKRSKKDKVDANKLGRELNNNNLEGIYIPSKEAEAFRGLSRFRIQLTKDQARVKNRIKSFLSFTGIEFPDNDEMQHWSGRFIKYLTELEFEHQTKKTTLDGLIENLRSLRKQLSEVTKELRRIVKQDETIKTQMKYLQSVPGIGFIIALTLYAEIMDINRFNKFDRIASFVGLTPDTDSTGENEKDTGITVRHNKHLRALLIQAAWAAIRKDPALTMAFGKLTRRMDKPHAIIRIAKKLLSRLVYVWKNQKEYVCSVVS